MLRLAALIACLALPAGAQSVGDSARVTGLDVSPATMQALAVEAMQLGEYGDARRFAEALLQRDPGDAVGLTVLAQSAFQTGDFTTARVAAARLYRTTDLPQARRYEAARLAALSALNEDRPTLSGLWLRRALTVAPTPEDAARTEADAAGVRRQNPWSFNIEAALTPSNNVNGGAQSSTFEIDGIPLPIFLREGTISRAGQALSGWTGFVDLRGSYRLAETSDARTTAGFRLRLQGSFLSQEARAFLDGGTEADQEFDNGDLTSALVEFRLSHDRQAARGTIGLEALLGAAWTAGNFGYSYARLSANRVYALNQTDALRGAVFYEDRLSTSGNYRDQQRYGMQATWIHNFAAAGRLSSTLGYAITDSPDTQLASVATSVVFSYSPAERIGPAEMTFTLGAQQSAYEDYQFFGASIPGGREDLRLFSSIDAFFPDMSYAGFAPVVSLDLGSTDSNVSRFDSTDYALGLNFRSTF